MSVCGVECFLLFPAFHITTCSIDFRADNDYGRFRAFLVSLKGGRTCGNWEIFWQLAADLSVEDAAGLINELCRQLRIHVRTSPAFAESRAVAQVS